MYSARRVHTRSWVASHCELYLILSWVVTLVLNASLGIKSPYPFAQLDIWRLGLGFSGMRATENRLCPSIGPGIVTYRRLGGLPT